MKDKTMTEREKVQASIGRLLGKHWYGSEQRLGQFLLNVARSDPELQARRQRIIANLIAQEFTPDEDDSTCIWMWDIRDEEWNIALKRYANDILPPAKAGGFP